MTMKKVDSSSVHLIGHDPKTNELHVQFHSGDTYSYKDVPADKYNALASAESIGKHLNAHIKPAHKVVKL